MGNLFGSPKKSTPKSEEAPRPKASVTSKDKAILDLKNARDRLKKYRKKLDGESTRLTEQAKLLIKADKREKALLLLKTRRYKENQANSIDSQLITILETIDTVEWEYANMEVLKALKAGNEALKKLHEEMPLEEVAALMDETKESIEMEKQISALISGQLSEADDTAILEELNELMGTKNPEPSVVSHEAVFPEVPDTPIVIDSKIEEIHEESPSLIPA